MTEPMHGGDPFAYPRSRTRPTPPCPHCGQPGGICDTHRAVLQEIKARWEAEKPKHDKKYSIRGANNGIVGRRRRSWKTDWDDDLDDQEVDAA